MYDEPIFEDEFFHRKPKKGKGQWTIQDAPSSLVPIADTHAHLDMLADPALALARAGVHNIRFVEAMVDPLSEEGLGTYRLLDEWLLRANVLIRHMSTRICGQGWNSVPKVRISIGVHPHEAKDYTSDTERAILDAARDPRTSAIGEIGLDYHYDLSPRDVQKEVFTRQVRIAKDLGLPIILHVREAFDDAFSIMREVGFPHAGCLLHCYTSDAKEIARWVDAGCYIAFGGALTFKNSDDIRAAARKVPIDRLLTETDSPYMAPAPFRGQNCEPAHVLWSAMALFALLHSKDESDNSADALSNRYMVYSSEEEKAMRGFFTMTFENALRLLDQDPKPYQTEGKTDCIEPS